MILIASNSKSVDKLLNINTQTRDEIINSHHANEKGKHYQNTPEHEIKNILPSNSKSHKTKLLKQHKENKHNEDRNQLRKALHWKPL
jgi:hypothetical protein